MTEIARRERFKKTIERQIIEERLRNAVVGEVVTYAELSKELRMDVRKTCLGALTSARKFLSGSGVHFDCIDNVGLKRLSDSEVVLKSENQVPVIRRAAINNQRRVSSVDYEHLSEDDKNKHRTVMSVCGAVAAFTKPSVVKKIQQEAKHSPRPLPVGETIRAFLGSDKLS
jgi:hypothetical protein